MMMSSGSAVPLYKSALDCWVQVARKEGVRGFFKGAWTNTLRGSGAAVVLVMYDQLQKAVEKYM